MRLDRDAALALEIHCVERLLLELARAHCVRKLKDAIGKRRLAVIDVRDDTKITYVFEFHFYLVALMRSHALLYISMTAGSSSMGSRRCPLVIISGERTICAR